MLYQAAEIFHVHNYSIPTTFDDGHTHRVFGVTSLGVLKGNTHLHYYRGYTTLEDGHVHYFGGVTGPAIFLPGGDHIHNYRGVTSFNDRHRHAYARTDSPSYSYSGQTRGQVPCFAKCLMLEKPLFKNT